MCVLEKKVKRGGGGGGGEIGTDRVERKIGWKFLYKKDVNSFSTGPLIFQLDVTRLS